MKKTFAPRVDYNLAPREHAIRDRHGYDYAIHEHESEKALRSLPYLKLFWKMYDMTIANVPLSLPPTTLNQSLYPRGDYDPYGANSGIRCNVHQLTDVFESTKL